MESSFPRSTSARDVEFGASEGSRLSFKPSRVGGRRSEAKVVVVIVIARRGMPSFLVSRMEAKVALMADRRARFRWVRDTWRWMVLPGVFEWTE